MGTGCALALLAALIATLGLWLTVCPIHVLQWVIGVPLLLLFGLRSLRKVILRAAGILALHDEASAYARHRRRRFRGAGEHQETRTCNGLQA